MSDELTNVMAWFKKWRQKVNLIKTETVALTKDTHTSCHHNEMASSHSSHIQMMLGIIIDENVLFKEHAEYTATKSKAALGQFSAFLADVRGAYAEVSIKLYNGCVKPHIEFGYPVWCHAPFDTKAKIEHVHQQALLRATNAIIGTPTSALKVVTDTPPLRPRFEDLLIIEYIKIIWKSEDIPLRHLVTFLRVDQSVMNHSRKSPLQHMLAVIKQASKVKVDVDNVEPQLPVTNESLLLPALTLDKRPWTGLGSS